MEKKKRQTTVGFQYHLYHLTLSELPISCVSPGGELLLLLLVAWSLTNPPTETPQTLHPMLKAVPSPPPVEPSAGGKPSGHASQQADKTAAN